MLCSSGTFDVDSLIIRSAVHTLPVPLLYIASKRHSDWAGPFQLSRNAAFHSATLVLTGGYLLFISAIGYYVRHVGGNWGRALALGCCARRLSFWHSCCCRAGCGRTCVFSSARTSFAIGTTTALNGCASPRCWPRRARRGEVGGLIIRGLADMLHCQSGGLWCIDSAGTHWFRPPAGMRVRSSEKEPVDSPFSRLLLEREWVVDLDEYRSHPERYAAAQVPAWLSAGSQNWLVVPLIVSDRLTGFVVLARPQAAPQVNWEVRDLLKTAARQAAGFLALMNATEALLEVRKFDAFNRMSAFVVHDLKNIVAQLSLMMQNAKRLKDNPEFQQDMLATVESSLEKMRRLMLQLREGEAPAGVSSGVALSPIFKRIEAAAAARGRAVEMQLVDPLVTRGHEERIERVLGHVVENALDATEASGRVCVSLWGAPVALLRSSLATPAKA